MRCLVLIILIAIHFLLIVVAGVAFHYLEQSHEQEVRTFTDNYIDNILANRPCLSREDLKKLVHLVLQAYDQGIISMDNSTSQATNWDMVSAMFFAGTVTTTIGYGHIAPSTYGGRLFCVLFALLSIPVCLVMLTGIGEKMNSTMSTMNDKMSQCHKHPKLGKILRTVLVTGCGVVLFLLIPSAIFVALEGWSYGESLYYSFITLTTIGFGDYVIGINPDESYKAIYRVCTWLWIILGLAWLSTVINMAQELFTNVVVNPVAEKSKELEEGLQKIKLKSSTDSTGSCSDVENADNHVH